MTHRILKSGGVVVLALAAMLLATPQSQAATPTMGGNTMGHFHQSGHLGAAHPQNGVFRHRFFPGGWRFGFGNPYLFNPYYNFDYTYAIAREQQYRADVLQLEQYRIATQYLQLSASIRHQANGLRSLQVGQSEAVPPYARPEPKRAPAVPQVFLTQEDRAQAKLKLANVLAEDGQAADAADYYREIVKKYPGTSAARQAQESLDKIASR
jgi:hypothetical protein